MSAGEREVVPGPRGGWGGTGETGSQGRRRDVPTVSVEDGMGAGGVGSQETSKMSWFTCSRESR